MPTSTAEVAMTVSEPKTRPLTLSATWPMTSEPTTLTTVEMALEMLYWASVIPRSLTMSGWNRLMQLTKMV